MGTSGHHNYRSPVATLAIGKFLLRIIDKVLEIKVKLA
jgi:hypothetical protein